MAMAMAMAAEAAPPARAHVCFRCKKIPDAIISITSRRTRIIGVALAFVASYLIDVECIRSGCVARRPGTSLRSEAPLVAAVSTVGDSRVRIFYNLFTKGSQDEDRVRRIVEEQFALIDPRLHDPNVSIISIGHKISLLPSNSLVGEHHIEGGEEITLSSVWEYCKSNVDARVIYLHSKGSYHPNDANNRLRDFVTRGALSAECADLPDACDVCSSRMSPLPHPHTSGNMWLAQCAYVARLVDPLALRRGALPERMREDDPCRGRGRYLSEHWVHGHPSVRPCDLHPGREFTWAHLSVPPRGALGRELAAAPRFRFDEYVLPGLCKDEHPETLSILDFVEVRRENYELLYNVTYLDDSWWGWEFLRRSIPDLKS